jgi:membrane protein
MSFEGLSAWVDRVIAWADRLQRRHTVLGFPYAVVKKYGDDGGGREAALITYYGFLSIFPLLLLGVAVLSRVLDDNPDLRQRLINAVVPQALQSTVEHSVTTLPTSTIPFVAGLIGLLFSGTGVVFSAYQTLNHVAAVPYRLRAGFVSRYVRVLVMLATLLLGTLAFGALTVVATTLPEVPGVQRAAAVLGSALVVFTVLLLGARVLLARPAPVRALWPGAIVGAAPVTVVLSVGPRLLARLVTKAGPVYGSFATVAGMFALLYLVSQALVYGAEVAAVRQARLWPRALDLKHLTAADVRALGLLAREQERTPAARVELHLVPIGSSPVTDGSSPAGDGKQQPLSSARDEPLRGWLGFNYRMVIVGFGPGHPDDLGEVVLCVCPNCHNQVFLHHVRSKKSVRLYFVPVVPYGTDEYLVCPVCSRGLQITSAQLRYLRSMSSATASFRAGRLPQARYLAQVEQFWHRLGVNPSGQQPVTPASPGAAAPAQPAIPVQPPARAQSPPVAADDETSWISQLQKLAQLHDQGILSDDAYAAAKLRILEHKPEAPEPTA